MHTLNDATPFSISIVIPTLNESKAIATLLPYLKNVCPEGGLAEIIVVDGGSVAEHSLKATTAQHQTGFIQAGVKNRAVQMNLGARQATGNVLYFLHADTLPPVNFAFFIKNAIENGHQAGCFRLKFDLEHWFLNACAWLTRFNCSLFRFGDQSLFVTKRAFQKVGGFNENLKVMEDQDIARNLKRHFSFKVIQKSVLTSARAYRKNGVFYQQGLYGIIFMLYYLGISQKWLQTLKRKWG